MPLNCVRNCRARTVAGARCDMMVPSRKNELREFRKARYDVSHCDANQQLFVTRETGWPMTENPDAHPVKDADYTTLADFRSALRKFLHTSEEIARGLGLTPQQHQVLLAVKGFPGGAPPTISQLAARLHVRHNSAVGLVNRLVGQRLVKRQRSQMDRRQVYVVLTPKGSTMLVKLTRSHRIELRRMGHEVARLLAELTR